MVGPPKIKNPKVKEAHSLAAHCKSVFVQGVRLKLENDGEI